MVSEHGHVQALNVQMIMLLNINSVCLGHKFANSKGVQHGGG